MSATALLIVNPGARRGEESREHVAARLRALGLEVIQESTADPETPPAELIRRHRDRIDRVIVGGGDGTLNAVTQGLVGTNLPLGILPLGTANNVARTLSIPLTLAQASALVVHGPRRRVDLGWVNGRYFFTTASIGLSVRITEALTAETKQRWGPLAYGVAALRVLRRSRPFHADISWPGGTRHSRTVQIVVGNGRYYGSGLPVAADATMDDARLDLYSIEVGHWWELLALVPALRQGRHGAKGSVETIRGTEFRIETVVPRDINVDGEICLQTPAHFRVLPGALEVFAPGQALE